MKRDEQIFQFGDELDKLVDRFRSEYDLTYAAIVGVLHIKAHILQDEAVKEESE